MSEREKLRQRIIEAVSKGEHHLNLTPGTDIAYYTDIITGKCFWFHKSEIVA